MQESAIASCLLKPAHAPQPVQEDPVAEEQFLDIGIDALETRLELGDPVEHAIIEVLQQAADPGVSRMEPVARHFLVDVVDLLAQVEGVEEGGEGPQVKRRGTRAEQMVADPRELRDDHPDVLAPRGQIDIQQLLDGADARRLR